MVVISKAIKVDFAPGEHVETAIKDALSMAAFVRVPIKFRFNGIPMTIDPPDWASIGFKCCVSPKKSWKKDVRKKIDGYLDEYHTKWDKREARVQKEIWGKKKTFGKGKEGE